MTDRATADAARPLGRVAGARSRRRSGPAVHRPVDLGRRLAERLGSRALAEHRGVRGRRRPDALPPHASTAPRRARPPPLPRPSTASSTTATSGSTAATSARPRATSSPTRSRSPTQARQRADEGHLARGRGRVPAAARPHGEADDHRRVLALGQPRPGLEPRRHLAAGAPARHRARPHQVAPCAVHRGDRDAWPAPARRHARLGADPDPVPLPARLYATVTGPDGRTLPTTTRDVMLAAGDNTLNLTRRGRPSTALVAVAARRPAAVRRRGRASRSAASRATTGRCAPRSARSACDNWQLTVNGERMFPMGSNHGPTRMALAEATADGADPAT